MMNKLLLLSLFSSFLLAKGFYDHTASYEESFSKELASAKRYIAYTKQRPLFKKSLHELMHPTFSVNLKNKKVPTPNYLKILSLLKKDHTLFSSYVGISLIKEHLLHKEISVLQNYALFFSKELIKENICSAYLFYGDTLITLKEHKKALVVFKEGKNHCKNSWYLSNIKQRILKQTYLTEKK